AVADRARALGRSQRRDEQCAGCPRQSSSPQGRPPGREAAPAHGTRPRVLPRAGYRVIRLGYRARLAAGHAIVLAVTLGLSVVVLALPVRRFSLAPFHRSLLPAPHRARP